MGGAEAGHYLSYALSPKGWLEFNDSCVTEFDFERLVEEKCFGTRRENQPQYFYDE
jgi:ubiquitin C-terminal hydrolase